MKAALRDEGRKPFFNVSPGSSLGQALGKGKGGEARNEKEHSPQLSLIFGRRSKRRAKNARPKPGVPMLAKTRVQPNSVRFYPLTELQNLDGGEITVHGEDFSG